MTRLHIAVRDGRKAIIPTKLPVVFSAGPVRNAPLWQNDAMRIAVKRDKPIFFACPLRDGEDGFAPDLEPYLASFAGENDFPRQRAMERYYLNQAGEEGCIFFYLAKSLPREQWKWPEKSYAQFTMKELGDWTTIKRFIPRTRLVIGVEEGFPELSTILFDIEEDLGKDFPIYHTLEQTVDAAIAMALS